MFTDKELKRLKRIIKPVHNFKEREKLIDELEKISPLSEIRKCRICGTKPVFYKEYGDFEESIIWCPYCNNSETVVGISDIRKTNYTNEDTLDAYRVNRELIKMWNKMNDNKTQEGKLNEH